MGNVRISLDVEEELKEYFNNRLDRLSEKTTVTDAIKAGMYLMLTLDDEKLTALLEEGKALRSLYAVIRNKIEFHKKRGDVPAGYKIGWEGDQKVLSILMSGPPMFPELKPERKKELQELFEQNSK